jgi:hypothetical protein
MVSHGNITHATLGMMVHLIEMAKIQEVCIHPTLLSCYPNLSPATGMGHP